MDVKQKLIDANELLKSIRDDYNINGAHFARIVRHIEATPSVDAVEVVHGRWLDSGMYHFVGGEVAICCSICGCALNTEEYERFNWNYCPVCGAKIDKVVDNNATN